MMCTRVALLTMVFGLTAETGAQDAPKASEVKDIQGLVKYVAARESAVRNIALEMESQGSFPDETRFTTRGSMRVLGGTHFHLRWSSSFGEDLQTETETVRTPDGVWMREKDPVQGEIFVSMSAERLKLLESASQALGGEQAVPGIDGRASQPLGSRMLEELSRTFNLKVDGPKAINGQRCWVAKGPSRFQDASKRRLNADQVDVVVRIADGAVMAMTQFRRGVPVTTVRITSLELDPPLEASTFKLDVPEDAVVLDVMDHPPHAAQIDQILQRAKDKGWEPPSGAKGDRSQAEGAGNGEKAGAGKNGDGNGKDR